MAGFRILGTFDGKTNYATLSLPVASGVTVTKDDLVYFSSGRITSASVAGARCIGVVQETATGNAGGTVKALVAIEPNLKLLAKNDNIGTTFAATHVGQYFDVIGATGAQLVDTSTVSATTNQLLCLEYNPQIDPYRSDTTVGVFVIAEHASHLGL
jgi:hypothetical protein